MVKNVVGTLHPPVDKGGLVWILFFTLGAGVLAPWNAFVLSINYFDAVYEGGQMDRWFPICYLPTMMIAMVALVHWSKPFAKNKSAVMAFVAASLVTLLAPMTFVFLDNGGDSLSLWITLGTVSVAGVRDAIAQGAILGDASFLPSKYSQAFATGTGFSGVLNCLLSAMSRVCFSNDRASLRQSTLLFFSMATVCCVLSYVLYICVLPGLPLVRYYREMGPDQADASSSDEDAPMLPSHDSVASLQQLEKDSAKVPLLYQEESAGNALFKMFKRLKYLAIGLMVTNITTLFIFPGMLAEDVHSKALGSWYNLLLILFYNLFDMIGKSLPSVIPYIHSNYRYFIWSLVRVAFLPIFYLTVKHFPDVWLVSALTIALGATNGFLTSNAYILGPKGLCEAHEIDLETNILVFSLATGLNIGAFGAWVWVLIL